MRAGELLSAFAKLESGRVAARIEVADELRLAGQPLAAFVVAGPRVTGIPDSYVAEIAKEIEANVAAGRLDPVVAGSVVWAASPSWEMRGCVRETSPLWLGIPDRCPAAGARPIPPDPRVVAAWSPEYVAGYAPASQLECVAAASGVPCGISPGSILASDLLHHQVAVAVVFIIAGRYCWRVPVAIVDEFEAAIERAAQLRRSALVLPPVIV